MSNSPYQVAALWALLSLIFFVPALAVWAIARKQEIKSEAIDGFLRFMVGVGSLCLAAAWICCSMGITGVK